MIHVNSVLRVLYCTCSHVRLKHDSRVEKARFRVLTAYITALLVPHCSGDRTTKVNAVRALPSFQYGNRTDDYTVVLG
jgi:hypothetical protein